MPAKISVIYINSTNIIRAEIHDRITGDPINSGSGTITFKSKDGTVLSGGTFTLSKVPATEGLWQVVVPYTFTATLQENQIYIIALQFTKDVNQLYAEQEVRAIKLRLA